MYSREIRDTAVSLLFAGYQQAEVQRAISEQYQVDVPKQTLSDWAARLKNDDALQARAEQYRQQNDARTWDNIGKAQEILTRHLDTTLDNTDKIAEAVAVLCSLCESGMFDVDQVAKASAAVDLLNDVKNIVSTRDALAVVKDLQAQSARSELLASGQGGVVQITLSPDFEEIGG